MSHPCWLIRPFQPADQEAVRRLILQGLGEHFGAVDETLNPDIDDIMARYVNRGHHFLVALEDREVIGSAALIVEDRDVGQLVRVSVASRYRRQGLARALVTSLINAASARGLTRLWMETNDDWEAAIGLYKRCGFTEYDRRDGNIYMSLALPRLTIQQT
jgi:ribosomal protein S18 acetylase RimI-like enzyme